MVPQKKIVPRIGDEKLPAKLLESNYMLSKDFIMPSRFMVWKNTKILGYEDSMADVKEAISRDFNLKKNDVYEVNDLEADDAPSLDEFLSQLRIDLTPRKPIKFPERKQQKPINRKTPLKASKPIARKTPLPRQTKSIKPKKPKVRRNDVVDDAYSSWLATQPCVITGRTAGRGIGPNDMHCHHIKGRVPRNDYLQVPLLGIIHSWPGSYHDIGKSRFMEKWGNVLGEMDVVSFFEEKALKHKERYDQLIKDGYILRLEALYPEN